MARKPKNPAKEIPEVKEVTSPIQAGNGHPEKDPGTDLKSYEIKSVDATAPVEGFDPKKNLRTVCSGVWRYICTDINAVKDEVFSSPLAKEFGMKENDMVYLVANKKHRIVVV